VIDIAVIVPLTAEMVRAAATVHLAALADSRSALMGERYVGSFVDWFRQPEHGGIALAAIDNRRDVVGYAIGAPLGYPRALSRHLFWTSAAATLTRPWLIFKPQFRNGIADRVRLVLTGAIPARTDLTLPPPTMTLAAMAVVRAFRRKKIGLRLLEDFEKRAAEMGMRSLRLSTRSDNVAARRLYEGSGWRLLSDSGELVYYCRTL
jgi:ribosomal protein S18 acetylase RimI-like enzyme